MKNALLREMAGIAPEFGHFALCHLGQHSFLLKLGDALLYLDPYLVPNPKRLIPPMIEADEASGALIVMEPEMPDEAENTVLQVDEPEEPAEPGVHIHSFQNGVCTECGAKPAFLTDWLPDEFYQEAEHGGTVTAV